MKAELDPDKLAAFIARVKAIPGVEDVTIQGIFHITTRGTVAREDLVQLYEAEGDLSEATTLTASTAPLFDFHYIRTT